MTDLEKFQIVNSCETPKDLADTILTLADPETGRIQGRHRDFDAKRMSICVGPVIHEGAPANLLTREFGIRQQALYVRYCIQNGI
jgi:hypothetical protein